MHITLQPLLQRSFLFFYPTLLTLITPFFPIGTLQHSINELKAVLKNGREQEKKYFEGQWVWILHIERWKQQNRNRQIRINKNMMVLYKKGTATPQQSFQSQDWGLTTFANAKQIKSWQSLCSCRPAPSIEQYLLYYADNFFCYTIIK